MLLSYCNLRRGAAALVAVFVLGAAQTSDAAPQLLVPAYFYPGGDELRDWERMTVAATQVALSVIVNPSTGPGSVVDPNYVQVIDRLADAGASLFGYIDSNYGQRSLDLMRKDVDDYLALYPRIAHGFFLDLVPSAGTMNDLATYSALYTYIKSKGSTLRVIGNPGVNAAEAYLTYPALDTLVTFENYASNYAGFVPDDYVARHSPQHFGHLIHDQPSEAAMLDALALATLRGAGYIFVSDVMQTELHNNAYDRLPIYWDAEVAALRAASVPLAPGVLYLGASLVLMTLRRRGAASRA